MPTSTRLAAWALGAAVCGMGAHPVFAQSETSFRTPSGNIFCMAYLGATPDLRCDLIELTPSFPARPADCELDWGHSFVLDATGPGYLACVGDTVIDPGAATLQYGQVIEFGPFTCVAEQTGLNCRNGTGNGFLLSRARQQLF